MVTTTATLHQGRLDEDAKIRRAGKKKRYLENKARRAEENRNRGTFKKK
jgi:hypothetical protein